MSDRKPGCWMFISAAFLIFCGLLAIGVGITVFVLDLAKMAKGMQRVVVPGSGKLKLDAPGSYTVFHEYRSKIEGRAHTSQAGLANLDCTVTDPNGEDVPLAPVNGSMTYNVGSRSGRAVWVFYADQPGTYTLNGARPGGATKPKAVLAVVGGFGKAIGRAVLWIFAGLGIGVVAIITGIVILIMALVLRSRRPTPAPATHGG